MHHKPGDNFLDKYTLTDALYISGWQRGWAIIFTQSIAFVGVRIEEAHCCEPRGPLFSCDMDLLVRGCISTPAVNDLEEM